LTAAAAYGGLAAERPATEGIDRQLRTGAGVQQQRRAAENAGSVMLTADGRG